MNFPIRIDALIALCTTTGESIRSRISLSLKKRLFCFQVDDCGCVLLFLLVRLLIGCGWLWTGARNCEMIRFVRDAFGRCCRSWRAEHEKIRYIHPLPWFNFSLYGSMFCLLSVYHQLSSTHPFTVKVSHLSSPGWLLTWLSSLNSNWIRIRKWLNSRSS